MEESFLLYIYEMFDFLTSEPLQSLELVSLQFHMLMKASINFLNNYLSMARFPPIICCGLCALNFTHPFDFVLGKFVQGPYFQFLNLAILRDLIHLVYTADSVCT